LLQSKIASQALKGKWLISTVPHLSLGKNCHPYATGACSTCLKFELRGYRASNDPFLLLVVRQRNAPVLKIPRVGLSNHLLPWPPPKFLAYGAVKKVTNGGQSMSTSLPLSIRAVLLM